MCRRRISEKSDLERAVEEFSVDTVEEIIRCANGVLSAGTNFAMRRIFLPATAPNPFAGDTGIDDACKAMEDFWKPRIQQYICEKVLDAASKVPDGERAEDESWAVTAAGEARDRLFSQMRSGCCPPYGLPRPLASSPVDQGGYAGWDRDLLLSPYGIQGAVGAIVDIVPYDEPGMMDALAYVAAVDAVNDLRRPNEAYRLSAARPFAPDPDRGGVPWDTERAGRRLAEFRRRCECTPAGNLVFAIRAGLRYPEVETSFPELSVAECVRHQEPSGTPAYRARTAATAIEREDRFSEDELRAVENILEDLGKDQLSMLRTTVVRACSHSHVYGLDGEAVRQASEDLMRCFREVIRKGALAAMADDRDETTSQWRGRMELFLGRTRHNIERLHRDDRIDRVVDIDGRTKKIEPSRRGPLRRFTIDRHWRSALDPVIAAGFVALDAGVAMPEAAYLLDLMEGWHRIVWGATILSCPEYGEAVPCDLDVHAGVCEIRERYDEVVPTLESVWQAAFERQWATFVVEMEALLSCSSFSSA